MRIKILHSLRYNKLEKKVNTFLELNKDDIEVIEIKWKTFIEHYVMIVYKSQ